MIIISCSKDSEITNLETSIRKKGDVITAKQLGIVNNGQWLVFKSQAHYYEVFDQIVTAIRTHEVSDEEQEIENYDFADELLSNLEEELGHYSLRTSLNEQEDELLENGEEPSDALNSLFDLNVDDQIEQAFVTNDGVVQIGDEISLYRRNYRIATTNPELANSILQDGEVVMYNPDNIDDVSIVDYGFTPVAPECSADFALLNQRENEDGTFTAVFLWAGNTNVANLSDLQLKWDFGDGSAPVYSEDGNITHTFSDPGNYSVCLDVSWVFKEEDKPDVPCEISNCMGIEMIQSPAGCKKALCFGLGFVSLLNREKLTELFVDEDSSTPGKMCLSSTGLLDILVDFCADIEPQDICYTLVETGQSVIGSGCFDILCDSDYKIELKIGDCVRTITIDYNRFSATCDDDDHKTDWIDFAFNEDQNKISYKLKTLSNEFDGGGRQMMWSRVKHYEKRNNGSWRKTKANLQIDLSGTIYGDHNCNCDVFKEASGTDARFGRYVTIREEVYEDLDGISAHEEDPWYASYTVNGQLIKTASCFD